jgi:DNA-directed RNA polymerase specialized sigma24 family protein
MDKGKSFGELDTKDQSDFLGLVKDSRRILLKGTKKAGLYGSKIRNRPGAGVFSPPEELKLYSLAQFLVHGPLRDDLGRVVLSKGVLRNDELSARQEVAEMFILSLPSIRRYRDMRSLRAMLYRAAQRTCRRLRRSELKLYEANSSENDEPTKIPGLTVRSLRREGSRLQETSSATTGRPSHLTHGEPILQVPDTIDRVPVELPSGINPQIDFCLDPDLAKALGALAKKQKDAILLRTFGYSRKEAAPLMFCSDDEYRRILLKARQQLRRILDPRNEKTSHCNPKWKKNQRSAAKIRRRKPKGEYAARQHRRNLRRKVTARYRGHITQ